MMNGDVQRDFLRFARAQHLLSQHGGDRRQSFNSPASCRAPTSTSCVQFRAYQTVDERPHRGLPRHLRRHCRGAARKRNRPPVPHPPFGDAIDKLPDAAFAG